MKPGRSKTSEAWLREHFDDPFVKKAHKEGFRCRAVYKLDEIQKKDRILKPGMIIVDLGAAPGGWSQLATYYMKGEGKIIALDILAMDPLPEVEIIQGDFREESVLNELFALVDARPVDLVMSDMAPNMSGNPHVDLPRAMHLCELALDCAETILKPGGNFLVKIFQGEGFTEFLQRTRQKFQQVVMRKPEASRDRSREQYLLAKGYKP